MKNIKTFELYYDNLNESVTINISDDFRDYNIKSKLGLNYKVFAWFNETEFNFSYIKFDKTRSLFTAAKYNTYNDGELLVELGDKYDKIDNETFQIIMDALNVFLDKKDIGNSKMFIVQRVAKVLEPIIS